MKSLIISPYMDISLHSGSAKKTKKSEEIIRFIEMAGQETLDAVIDWCTAPIYLQIFECLEDLRQPFNLNLNNVKPAEQQLVESGFLLRQLPWVCLIQQHPMATLPGIVMDVRKGINSHGQRF